MARRIAWVSGLVLTASFGCAVDPGAEPYTGEHTFPVLALEPGDEILDACQAWTLNNEEELFVHEVEMSAGPGWHHSNWMFVPGDTFEGPDGTFDCADRRFSEISANLMGGAVFFAQSTQSTGETQRFPEGAAYRIPPHSRVIGKVHVLNTSPDPIESAITFRIGTIPEEEVETLLQPLAMDNRALELPPRVDTELTMACDFAGTLGTEGAIEGVRIFYVLPHYHALAHGMRVTIHGGEHDGEIVFESTGGVGNVLGGPIDPPLDLTGALGLRMTCTYTNSTSETITWGESAANEMCTMLAYVEADRALGGSSIGDVERTTVEGGELQEANCFPATTPGGG